MTLLQRWNFVARALVAFALLAAACAPVAAEENYTRRWRPMAVSVRAVDLDPRHPGPRRIGALIFRGGLELSSEDWAFGGWSGLWVGADGRLVAVTDKGLWMSAQIRSDPETAAPTGFLAARMGFLRDTSGERFDDSENRDAEGLARLDDGRFAVSFEHSQSILVYDLFRLSPQGAGVRAPALIGAERLLWNVGLEAIAPAGEGKLLVASERGENGEGRAIFWLADLDSDEPAAATASLDLPFGFGLAGLDRLPDGDFIALERFYAPVLGVRVRIMRIAAASLASGGRAAAAELAELAPPLNIDNFESVAAVPLRGGGARLYLISDDNYSPTQRTLLYVFDMLVDEHPRP